MKLAKPWDFCPNEECQDYQKLQEGLEKKNIQKYGKTKAGKQRYQCTTCKKTFAETKGTIFYKCRSKENDIIDTLSQVAENTRISSLSRTTGHTEDTILRWIRAAGKHAESLEEELLNDYRIESGQLDGLWSYVKNKGGKKSMLKPKRPERSGDQQ